MEVKFNLPEEQNTNDYEGQQNQNAMLFLKYLIPTGYDLIWAFCVIGAFASNDYTTSSVIVYAVSTYIALKIIIPIVNWVRILMVPDIYEINGCLDAIMKKFMYRFGLQIIVTVLVCGIMIGLAKPINPPTTDNQTREKTEVSQNVGYPSRQ